MQSHPPAYNVLQTELKWMRSCSLTAAPKGFSAFEDVGDGYKFLYPFGWQEVAVDGADVVFKDIVEPLEYISVTITTTEKTDIAEFGTKEEVCAHKQRGVSFLLKKISSWVLWCRHV